MESNRPETGNAELSHTVDRGIVILALALLIGVTAWLLYDERLGARETERALQARVGDDEPLRCRRAENDGSLSLEDVDYICIADDGWPMYAVATSSSEITEVEQFGGP
jgi:hypothetical protein